MKKLVIKYNNKTIKFLVNDDYDINKTLSSLNSGGKFIKIQDELFKKAAIKNVYMKDTTVSDFLQEIYPRPRATYFGGDGSKRAMIKWCNTLHEKGMPDEDLKKIIADSGHFNIGELSYHFPYLYNSKVCKAIGIAGFALGIFNDMI